MNTNKIAEQKEKQEKLEKSIISSKDFILKELPESRWVVKCLIPEGMTILSSSPGQFKTYLLLELSKQIARGELGFNYFELEKRNVLFINEEMGENLMQDRLKALDSDEDNLYISNLEGIKIEDAEILLDICKEKKITLVVFDSLTRIHNLSENDASDVKKIFESIVILLKEGISVVMTHHHRKSPIIGTTRGSDEMRGSTDLLAQIDCHLAVDAVAPDKNYLIIKQLKLRQAENIPDFRINIERKDGKISFAYKGEFSRQDANNIKIEENKEVVLDIISQNPGITKEEIFTNLSGKLGKETIQAILPKLESENIIYSKTQRPKTYYLREEINLFYNNQK